MPRFAIGNILLPPSRFITECNIQNFHSRKRCRVRFHINWVQDFNLMLYRKLHFRLVKYWKKLLYY